MDSPPADVFAACPAVRRRRTDLPRLTVDSSAASSSSSHPSITLQLLCHSPVPELSPDSPTSLPLPLISLRRGATPPAPPGVIPFAYEVIILPPTLGCFPSLTQDAPRSPSSPSYLGVPRDGPPPLRPPPPRRLNPPGADRDDAYYGWAEASPSSKLLGPSSSSASVPALSPSSSRLSGHTRSSHGRRPTLGPASGSLNVSLSLPSPESSPPPTARPRLHPPYHTTPDLRVLIADLTGSVPPALGLSTGDETPRRRAKTTQATTPRPVAQAFPREWTLSDEQQGLTVNDLEGLMSFRPGTWSSGSSTSSFASQYDARGLPLHRGGGGSVSPSAPSYSSSSSFSSSTFSQHPFARGHRRLRSCSAPDLHLRSDPFPPSPHSAYLPSLSSSSSSAASSLFQPPSPTAPSPYFPQDGRADAFEPPHPSSSPHRKDPKPASPTSSNRLGSFLTAFRSPRPVPSPQKALFPSSPTAFRSTSPARSPAASKAGTFLPRRRDAMQPGPGGGGGARSGPGALALDSLDRALDEFEGYVPRSSVDSYFAF